MIPISNAMHEITLEELSANNIGKVLAIEVFDHQIDFVPPVKSSIEMASKYAEASCRVIRCDETVCGYSLYGLDEETRLWKIYRLVIDRHFQGKGIGKRALQQILDILRDEHQADDVLIVYAISNSTAHHLYSTFGFKQYGDRDDRILSKLSLAEDK